MTLEFKDTQTNQIKVPDCGNFGMESMAYYMQKALSELVSECGDIGIKDIEVRWLNFREKLNNPGGDQGSFMVRFIREVK